MFMGSRICGFGFGLKARGLCFEGGRADDLLGLLGFT